MASILYSFVHKSTTYSTAVLIASNASTRLIAIIKNNHTFERELGFLALHGFLHLLGYDHMTEEEEKQMFGRQDAILDAYGLTRDK